MVPELYPRVHRRYTSLAILGPVLDGYGTWLLEQGYSTERLRDPPVLVASAALRRDSTLLIAQH